MVKPLIALVLVAATAGLSAQPTPYAGQQDRQLKALSQQEVGALLAGEGSGLAKAAELNGYPGPAHVLEHAEALALSEQQRRATETLMQTHKARARTLGAELVQAEQGLDDAFVRRVIDAPTLASLTAAIGNKQAQLRQEHLQTHLLQTALLTPAQVRRYAELRGYASGPVPDATQTQQHRRQHH